MLDAANLDSNIKDGMKKLMDDMQKTQKTIKGIIVTGVSGGGLVKITMNGLHETIKIQISQTLLGDDEEQSMVEDLVLSANNDAAKKLESAIKNKIMDIAKDMKLPKELIPENIKDYQ